MASDFKILWSEEAVKNLNSILTYLENEWGQKSVEKFKRKLRIRLDIISKNPTLFKKSAKNPNLRHSVLNKQTTIIYKIDGDAIFITYLFDNRQNPSKIE